MKERIWPSNCVELFDKLHAVCNHNRLLAKNLYCNVHFWHVLLLPCRFRTCRKKLQLCYYLKKEGNYLQKANIDSEALQFTLLM